MTKVKLERGKLYHRHYTNEGPAGPIFCVVVISVAHIILEALTSITGYHLTAIVPMDKQDPNHHRLYYGWEEVDDTDELERINRQQSIAAAKWRRDQVAQGVIKL